MRSWSFPTFLLFAIISATTIPAHEIDAALAKQEKRQVNLSTAASDSSVASSRTSAVSSSAVASSSASSSQNSVVVESSTVTASATASPTTIIVQSTITRASTQANGQTTQVQQTVSSTAVSSVAVSYSRIVTSSASQVLSTYTEVQGGSTVTGVRTSSTLVPVTTSSRVATALAGESSSGSGGLSSSSKKIIGGVVGGIGGALVLGAIAYTVWRIWGKKKNLHDDDLYDPNANTEKMSSSTDNQQPFRTTLDQYHNPGPVNTASNF